MGTSMAGGGALASQGQGQDQTPNSGQQQARQVLDEFRSLAETVQGLAKKYPEFVEAATQILPLISKGMSLAAGNPERVPEKQAPPVGP